MAYMSISNLHERIKKYSNVYIYGAGLYGRMALALLKQIGVIPKAFLETNYSGEQSLEGIPIFSFFKWNKIYKNEKSLILIAVSDKYKTEIEQIVKGSNGMDYIVMEETLFCAPQIALIDTSVSDPNHGNQVIMESIRNFSNTFLNQYFITEIPGYDDIWGHALSEVKKSEFVITGGTNLICYDMEKERYLGINNVNRTFFKNKVVLMGAGLQDIDHELTDYSKELFKDILSDSYIHSVRDDLTKQVMKKMGIENVVNTGCPTIWGIGKSLCDDIPIEKSENVLVMSSGWDYTTDKAISDIIRRNYKKIFMWGQEAKDSLYLKTIYPEGEMLGFSLMDLDMFLKNNVVDYVGTRLHGGIRCIQNRKRSIIIAIDHRAKAMREDFNLPVVDSKEDLEAKINSFWSTDICLPYDTIRKWKKQFFR